VLLRALSSSFKFLPENQRQAFLEFVNEQVQWIKLRRNRGRSGSKKRITGSFASMCCGETAGAANSAVRWQTWKFTTNNFAATPARIVSTIWSPSVPIVTLPPTAYLSGKFASVRTSPWQQGVRILSSSRG